MKSKKRNLVKEVTEELIHNQTSARKLIEERDCLDKAINEYKDANRHKSIRDKFGITFVPTEHTHWHSITISPIPSTEGVNFKPENPPEIIYALGIHESTEILPALSYVEAKQLKNLRDYLNTLELE